MNKFYRITMPDGSKWDVPVEVIVHNRATYYSNLGDVTPEKKDEVYAHEVKFAMESEYEIQDWAENNMDWSDVAWAADIVVEDDFQEINFQEGWVNGVKEFVTR